MNTKTIALWLLGICLSVGIFILDVDLTILADPTKSGISEIIGVNEAQASRRSKASARHKADCNAWCDSHSNCEFCSTKRFCGFGYSRLKLWDGFGTNYSACEAPNKVKCDEWCDANEECLKCDTLIGCGFGYKNLMSFTKDGLNWHACEAPNKAKCEEWCKADERCVKCDQLVGCGRDHERIKSFKEDDLNWYACKAEEDINAEVDQCCQGRDLLSCSYPAIASLLIPWPFSDREWKNTFLDACVRHDYCYYYGDNTYGKTRWQCDSAFQQDMFEICKRDFGVIRRPICFAVAQIYFKGARGLGDKHFDVPPFGTQICEYPDKMTTSAERVEIGQCRIGGLGKVRVGNELDKGRLWVNIQNVASGKCLDVTEDSEENGENIQQWECKQGRPNQLFAFDFNELGANILNQRSNICLDVTNESNNSGANIQQWECHQGANQAFRLEIRDRGWLNIINVGSGKCLEVADANKNNGANIQQWECNDSPRQLFRIVEEEKEATVVNAYFPSLTPKDKGVEITLDTNSVCEPGFSAGTFTISARFENTSIDTTLSNIGFEVKKLSGGTILCNVDGLIGGEGATLTAVRQDDYEDGLLGPGEHFFQTFEVGLDDLGKFTLLVDLLGVIDIDETAPSLIQSNLGPEDNNLEVVVREDDNKLHHYFREKKDAEGNFVWAEGSEPFAEGATSAPSLIQSTLGPEDNNNLEVVVRGPDRKLHQYFRTKDVNDNFVWIEGSEPFAPGSTSAPALIQSNLGPEDNNLEVVVREDDNKLHHYFREKKDAEGNFVWVEGSEPFAEGVTSAPSLIQSNLGPEGNNNLEVVVQEDDNELHQYFRTKDVNDNFVWVEGSIPFAPGSTSAPSLIQSTLGGAEGNFEVAVREGDEVQEERLQTYVRLRDDQGPWFWEFVDFVGPAENVTSAPSMVQSNLGQQEDNFELVVREGDEVRHYFRERISTDPEVFEWKFGGVVTQ